MVEMYLDPEIEVVWAQAGQGTAQPALEPNVEAVHAAQTLLLDVQVTEGIALQHQVQLSKIYGAKTMRLNVSLGVQLTGLEGLHDEI